MIRTFSPELQDNGMLVNGRTLKCFVFFTFVIILNNLPVAYSQKTTLDSSIYCLDFGLQTEEPEPGFVRVSPARLWSIENGYGWIKKGILATSRRVPDEFRKDKLEYSFHEGTGENTFRVSLTPREIQVLAGGRRYDIYSTSVFSHREWKDRNLAKRNNQLYSTSSNLAV